MNDSVLVELLHDAATAVRDALGTLDDWGSARTRPGQYRTDLVADAAVLAVLGKAPVAVLSEESGLHDAGRDLTVVVDPVDGSTNASRGIPWFATSLCAVDGDGPRATVVVNQATGDRFEAVRGGGARLDGVGIASSGCASVRDAMVGVSGLPASHLGWRQFRSLGAVALDLCAVAAGVLDGYADCSVNAHGPWDYLGGLLLCQEAGAVVVDAHDRELVVLSHTDRRTPVAGATAALASELQQALVGTLPKKITKSG